MLCAVAWTQSTHVQRRRRAPMQLELLPPHKSPQSLRVWEGMTQEQRTALIAALARLMRMVVTTEPRRNPDER